MGIPIAKINIRRLLTGLGLLVVLLLAVAFVLGLLSLQRTREIVSEDFQQQQLILAKTTARQIEDGLEFLRRELKILNYSPAIQYLEEVAWANRMKVIFDDLSKLGVTAIERIDFAGPNAGRTYILDAKGPRVIDYNVNEPSPEVTWAKNPANRGRVYQGPEEIQTQGDHKIPFFLMATPVYEESVDESHPKATGHLDGVLLFKIDASQFTGRYCADIRSGRTGYCWVLNSAGVFLYHPEREFLQRKKSVKKLAEEEFFKLGIDKTRDKTGILIFFLLEAREFHILADEGIHKKVPDNTWDDIKDEMQSHFIEGKFSEGIIHGIGRVGKILSEKFPIKPYDTDEISNRVVLE